MRRILVLIAAGVVLASNAWVPISVWRGRSDERGGRVELTERELRLPERIGESTALFMKLDWDALSVRPDHRREPRWLDAAKLAKLGFDCGVAVTAPDAKRHYRSMRTALVFVVLEHEGDTWKQAPANRKRETRLFAIDAGRDPEHLRATYTDTAKYIITRGLVSLSFQEREIPGGNRLPEPRLQGVLGQVLPDLIFVPRPHNDELEQLRTEGGASGDREEEDPRFAATISWGRRYEPWVSGVRRME